MLRLGGRITGVVDWVGTSIAPAWLDVAHCATNLVIVHGDEVARQFDAMDIVGFLRPTGKVGFFNDESGENRRLEDRRRSVVESMDR